MIESSNINILLIFAAIFQRVLKGFGFLKNQNIKNLYLPRFLQ
jgi:hypothetical protein